MNDRHRGPRTNRSKKTLPAEFFSGRPRRESSGPRESSPALQSGRRESSGRREIGDAREARDGRIPSEALLRSGYGGAVGSRARAEEGEERIPAQHPPPGTIRLEALVLLSSLAPQRRGATAASKKMLHPPSLELFALVELPGTDPQRRAPLRAALEGWLVRWRQLQIGNPRLLVGVREAYWDAPAGYPAAILCEHAPLGSLEDLVRACGGLPEHALREVARSVLEALDVLHSAQPPLAHGCVRPAEVLFDHGGAARLAFGLEQRLRLGSASASGGASVSSTPPGRGREAGLGEPSHPGLEASKSTVGDLYDLGLLVLVAALGGYDVLHQVVPYARKFGSRLRRGMSDAFDGQEGGLKGSETCLLLQNELTGAIPEGANLLDDTGGEDDRMDGGDGMGTLPPVSELLFNRKYSEPFISFVSACLEAHAPRRGGASSARELLRHSFLHTQAPAGPLVSLHEMQELARLLDEASEHDRGFGAPGAKRESSSAHRGSLAPSVERSAQLYLDNIAQSVAPYYGPTGAPQPNVGSRARSQSDGDAERGSWGGHGHAHSRWGSPEWEVLLDDSARTLGLPRHTVQATLEARLERLAQISARPDRRDRGETCL